SGPPDNTLGDTQADGIPVVPPAGHADRFPADGPDDSVPEPAPVPAAPPPAGRPAKGRSKLMLLAAAVVGVLGIAYGVGLLLDHADVPNGTTVLGVDIGGTTKQEAVETLDAKLGERASAPLTLSVGGTEQQLKPSVAGLSLDTEATVRNASGRDYNPLSVIGSLVGGSRAAEPAFTVDEEKLKAALADLTGDGGAAQDGMVKFTNGKAVAVPGEVREGVDPEQSAAVVEGAYRQRAATGENNPVKLPVTKLEPKVTEQELQRAVTEFGEPAMSGLVTVRAGTAEISFSPERSLPQFLSMRATKDGKLVDHYDLKALKELYGSTFDGIEITRGNGSKTAVTPQDVAGALRPALTETDPAKRVGVIPLDPQ
ncbi:peptidoglycan binding domain-containing protein, partial [Streptomyces sparsus]